MFANSLFMRFSSSSRARALRRSAMNWTSPRMDVLLDEEDRPRKPAAAALASLKVAPVSGRRDWDGAET